MHTNQYFFHLRKKFVFLTVVAEEIQKIQLKLGHSKFIQI